MNRVRASAFLAVCGVTLAATGVAVAGPLPKVEPVTDRVGVIYGPFDLPDRNNRGFRNNVVITRTAGGLVVFDPGGSAWAGEMVVRVCAQSYPGEPIVAVFNSHAHGDHWLGNEGVRRHYPGVPIHAHPRMLEKAAGNDGHAWLATINRVTDGAADGRNLTPPDQAVGDGDELTIGDVQFRILHTGSAHTDNDLMIEIVGEDVLFMGDVVRNGMLGIMEGDSDFAGNIEAIDQIVARGFRHYIPGHGRAGGAETALVYRDYLHGVRSTVARLYEEGAEDFEMKPQVEMAVDRFRDWVGFDLRLGAHVSRVYLEVEAAAF